MRVLINKSLSTYAPTLDCLPRSSVPLSMTASTFAAQAPSQPWPLKCHDAHRKAAASGTASSAPTSRVPLAAQTTQHRQHEKLK